MGEVVQEGDGGCAVGQGAHDPRGKRRRNWGDCKGAATEGGRQQEYGVSLKLRDLRA